jgi:aminoglycoside phosphotransferase (APT) family kinase protein
MLSRPDIELVARDPALPALATLLDPTLLIEQLTRLRPGLEITDPSIFYLRYKPHTSCLAGYRVMMNGVEILLSICARRPDALDKVEKHRERKSVTGPLGTGRIVCADLAMTIAVFPNDNRVPALRRMSDSARENQTLEQLGLGGSARLEQLRYRPERRLVCKAICADGTEAVVKFYRTSDYKTAATNAHAFGSQGSLRVPTIIGNSIQSSAVASSWIAGGPVLPTQLTGGRVGAALADLHAQQPEGLAARSRVDQARAAGKLAQDLAALWPALENQARAVADGLSRALMAVDAPDVAIHGDFHVEQLIDADDRIGIVDLDEASYGAAAWDLGNIIGQLHLSGEQSDTFGDALLAGYRTAGGKVTDSEVRLQTALSIFHLASRPFRERHPQWPEKIEGILDQASQFANAGQFANVRAPARPLFDPDMPQIEAAIDPKLAQRQFSRFALAPVTAAQLVRHKPGRRCLIEYHLTDGSTLIGKMRARGADSRCFAIQQELWGNGFGRDAADRIMVAEPVAIVPDLALCLQRKVDGTPLNITPERAAAAIAKLHRSGVKPAKRHMLADELRILRERLAALALRQPQWRNRLKRLEEDAAELADQAEPVHPRSIHRDFYHDHLISDGVNVHIIDLDLFCVGDPAVDIGNYTAHLIELGLRLHGDADWYCNWRQAFELHYRKHVGDVSLINIRIYELLSLLRLIEISDRIEARRPFTEKLLGSCEDRLARYFSARRKTQNG